MIPLMMLTLTTCSRCWCGFFIGCLFFYLSIFIGSSLHLKREELCSMSLKGLYIHKLFRIWVRNLSLLPYVFSNYSYHCGLLDTSYRLFLSYFFQRGEVERTLLAPSVQKPGMLLNILQCTEQILTKRVIWHKMSIALRLRNISLEALMFSFR